MNGKKKESAAIDFSLWLVEVEVSSALKLKNIIKKYWRTKETMLIKDNYDWFLV